MSGKWVVPATIVLVALSAECAFAGTSTTPLAGTPYSAKVRNTRMFVGVETLAGGQVRAYVCDGRRVGAWFTGPLRSGRIALRGRHGTRLSAHLTESAATGSFRVNGRTYRFRAARSFGPAGVQQLKQPKRNRVTRWVVLSDGRYRGIVHELESDEISETAPPPTRPGIRHEYTFADRPKGDSMGGWAGNAQGIADDDSNFWFFTNETLLIRYAVGFDLAVDISTATPPNGVRVAAMPPVLRNLGYDHYGDLDYYKGFLFVPVTKIAGGIRPAIAVFRASDLSYVTHKVLSTGAQLFAGWLAIDPGTGTLYSSNGTITNDTNHFGAGPLFQYTFTLAKLSAPTPVLDLALKTRGPVLLFNGAPVRLDHIQGGVFSPRRDFYLIMGINDEHTNPEGIVLFDIAGKRLTQSCADDSCRFRYEFHPGGISQEEPEGLTWWTLPIGVAPGIHGSLHAMMVDNDFPDTDDLFVKHYSVA